MSLSFGTAKRLRSPEDFRCLFRSGKRFRVPGLLAVYLPCDVAHEGRLGLAISKKVLRRAVDRNLLKRHVRESFRLKPGINIDVVIVAQSNLQSIPAAKWRGILDDLWHTLNRR